MKGLLKLADTIATAVMNGLFRPHSLLPLEAFLWRQAAQASICSLDKYIYT